MRRARFAIRCKMGVTADDGAVQTTKTVSTPIKHLSGISGIVRAPCTNSACGGKRAASGLRTSGFHCEVQAHQLSDNLPANSSRKGYGSYRIIVWLRVGSEKWASLRIAPQLRPTRT
jgi:hypothetical protein